ncbi:AAA family ATPase [Candidatus Woesearchaeota archaeon]|nr:AAA family ATPase [Candidatus Woesearchaeota archaeon]
MLLKKIRLQNIRSYRDEEIEFPEGNTLLSGNIGCGKSTILQAIDFALFGISQELSGASLLRNGEDHGAVELHFTVENKEVAIKRTLRRGTSVVQDAGHISIDNAKREATATELKQQILTLLNYPQELLTKSKSLMYRYTVYTPQEEMKSILLGDRDYRIDALRKVFGIDRYKRLKENAEIVMTYIKAKNRENAIMIADLEQKKTEQERLKQEKRNLRSILDNLIQKLQEYHLLLEEKKKKGESIEKEIKEFEEKKKNLEITEISLKHQEEEVRKNLVRMQELDMAIQQMEAELNREKPPQSNQQSIMELEKKLSDEEVMLRRIINRIQECQTTKSHAKKILGEIEKLDVCPVCKQKVSPQHIGVVMQEAKITIAAQEKELQQLQVQEQQQEQAVAKVKTSREHLNKADYLLHIYTLKKKNVEEKRKEKEDLEQNNKTIKKDKEQLESLLFQLKEQTKQHVSQEIFKQLQEEIETIQEHKKKAEIEKATKEHELEGLDKQLDQLARDITKKEVIRNNIGYLKELHYWLENMFINIVTTLEKKIMLKIHADFSSLFKKWFEILVDTEEIKVSLDDEFSPIIEQQGHEIKYTYLSGGEKTAAALAYRLALNQVINAVMSIIRTKDLLILDEPTDGFSAEQIDRLRIILEELKTKQVIIVSHENKIESFVQHVIKIEKKDNISAIANQ